MTQKHKGALRIFHKISYPFLIKKQCKVDTSVVIK